MAQLTNPLEIFKLLDNSNCRQCGQATCMAFAAAVFRGQQNLSECPKLDAETVAKFSTKAQSQASPDQEVEETVKQLKKEIPKVDLAAAAQRLGGRYKNGKITVKVLGKDFHVDSNGRLSAEIHTNAWVSVPVLTYILYGNGINPIHKWVPFRELSTGRSWAGLFEQRCEKPLKQIADSAPDLFTDLLDLFSGQDGRDQFDADVALILHPLPKVPMAICYWKAEDGLDSSLHVFFDATVEENLNIGSIFSLGAGLVRMLEKLVQRHQPQAAMG
ncbi:MAG: DUF3786 domain-containing protein [Desulfovermiculus sp.]